MNKMRTNFKKRSTRWITAILAVTLAVTLAVAGGMSASAAYGTFMPYVAGYSDGRTSAVFTSALGTTVNFRSNGIFYTPNSDTLYYVKAFKIVSDDMGTSTPLKLSLTKSSDEKGWTVNPSSTSTEIIYKEPNGNTIQPGTFNELMSKISVSFNSSAHVTSAIGNVSICAYNSTRCDDSKDLIEASSSKRYYVQRGDTVQYLDRYSGNVITRTFDPSSSRYVLGPDGSNHYCNYYNGDVYYYTVYTYTSTYTCKLIQYDYATGSIVSDDNTPVYEYKNSYANYHQSYDDAVADEEKDATSNQPKLELAPDNSGQGKFTFKLKLDDFSIVEDGADKYSEYASIGFQIREEGQSWDSSIPKLWLKADNEGNVKKTEQGLDFYEVAQYIKQYNYHTEYYYDSYYGRTRSRQVYDTTVVGSPIYKINLADYRNGQYTIVLPSYMAAAAETEAKMTQDTGEASDYKFLDSLTYGKTYYVRGMVATDGKTGSPTYTDEVSFRYDPPNISNFKIGSTAVKYGNKNMTMDLSMLATFIGNNSMGKTFYANGAEGQDGDTVYTGPTLQAKLYFTPHKVTVDNTYDASEWIPFTGNQKVKSGDNWVDKVDDQGKAIPVTQIHSMIQNGVRETDWPYPWDTFKIPETLAEVDPIGHASSTEKINSADCAFKLVVTDLYTGYSVASISNKFSIDAGNPTEPTLYAKADFKNANRTGKENAAVLGISLTDAEVATLAGKAVTEITEEDRQTWTEKKTTEKVTELLDKKAAGTLTSAEAQQLADLQALPADKELSISRAYTVGGADGSVDIYVDGATDVASEIREYQYASYFLPSSAINTNNLYKNKTAQAIFQILAGQTFTTARGTENGVYSLVDANGNLLDANGNQIVFEDGKYYSANKAAEITDKVVLRVAQSDWKDANGTAVTVTKNGDSKTYQVNGSDITEENVSKWRDANGGLVFLKSGKYQDANGTEIASPVILNELADLGDIEYTTWSAAAAVKDSKGVAVTDFNGNDLGQISVAKDGFYCIIAKAIDGAERESDTTKAYFRVDLTPPSRPDVRLVKINSSTGELEKYENTNYTAVDVVLLAYSAPKTGKTLADFEYTTDGGLTWTSMLAWQTTATEGTYEKSKVKVSDSDKYVEDYFTDGVKTKLLAEATAAGKTVPTGKTATGTATTAPAAYAPLKAPESISIEGDTNFTQYQIALKVSQMGYSDYTDFQVRAKDDLGNVSAVSPSKGSGVMRTTPGSISAKASMTHDTIEVALAIGNTQINLDDITPDLKNRGAQKINNKYYWSKTKAQAETVNAALLTNLEAVTKAYYDKDTVTSAEQDTVKNAMGYTASVTDSEAGIIAAMTVKLPSATPSEAWMNAVKAAGKFVNFAGYGPNVSDDTLSKMDQKGILNPYILIATYGMRAANNSVVQYDGKTAAAVGTNDATVPHKCEWGGDASCSGACHEIGIAECPYDRLADLGYSPYKPEYVNVSGMSSGSGDSGMEFYHFDRYDSGTIKVFKGSSEGNTDAKDKFGNLIPSTYTTLSAVQPADEPTRYYKEVAYNGTTYKYYTAANHWVNNDSPNTFSGYGGQDSDDNINAFSPGSPEKMACRPLHVVAFGNSSASDNTSKHKYSNSADPKFAFAEFRTYGYYNKAPRDWVLAYNDSPAKKQIAFTINDNNVFCHSNDGYGFLWNVTQRQQKGNGTAANGTWVISGYIFYMFNDGGPGGDYAYAWSIGKFEDLPMSTLHDKSASGTQLGCNWLSFNASRGTRQSNIKVLWTATNSLYGSGTTVNKRVRHFRLVCSGNTTKVYMWQEGTSSTKTPQQLEDQFNKDTNYGKSAGITGTGRFTTGYSAINFANGTDGTVCTWYNTSNSTFNYSNKSAPSGAISGITLPSGDTTELYTPRPSVDGDVIGSVGYDNPLGGNRVPAANVHKDTNCFGFGLIVGANEYNHGCGQDTQIIYSNMKLQITQTKKLSEVVTEPSWGSGKAKFIANLSDDAVTDFADPVLNSAIQWRLNNDQAKYVGWGFVQNKAESESFLSSMAKATGDQTDTQALDEVGMYEPSDYTSTNTANRQAIEYDTQIDDIATYMTQRYFAAFGFNPYASTSISDQLTDKALVKGAVYDINDVENIVFDVTPSDYKKSSANPDFPAGRWYMVHDTTGYTNSSGALYKKNESNQDVPAPEVDPRSGSWSDALETSVTLPGRYSYFFAPEKGPDGKPVSTALTTQKAAFSFVVNQAPVAQFTAQMKDYAVNDTDSTGAKVNEAKRVIEIKESSYDPDSRKTGTLPASPSDDQIKRQYQVNVGDVNSARDTYTNITNPFNGSQTDNSLVLNGIVKWEWRYEVLVPATQVTKASVNSYSPPAGVVYQAKVNNTQTDVVKRIDPNGKEMLTVISSPWTSNTNAASPLTNSPHNKTLTDLVNGLTGSAKTEAQWYLKYWQQTDSAGSVTTNNTADATAIKTFNDLPSSAIVNVYLRVTDQSTYKDEDGVYKKADAATRGGGKVSTVCQVNVAAKAKEEGKIASNPASSSMTLSKLSMYDTSKYSSSDGNKQITVERTSSHSQAGVAFAPVFKISRGGDKNMVSLVRNQSVTTTKGTSEVKGADDVTITYNDDNYYWKVTTAEAAAHLFHKWDPTADGGAGAFKTNEWAAANDLIPVLVAVPNENDNNRTGENYTDSVNIRTDESTTSTNFVKSSTNGKWAISYKFLEEYLKDYKDATTGMTLQINEVVYGYSAEDLATKYATAAKKPIIDSSARTLFFKTDKNAPSAQVVTVKEIVRNVGNDGLSGDGTVLENLTSDYNASQFLDVTDYRHFLRVTITGSADLEGKTDGYGYYFYTKDGNGRENGWYSLRPVDKTSDAPGLLYDDYKLAKEDPTAAKYTIADTADYATDTVSTTEYQKYYVTQTNAGEKDKVITGYAIGTYLSQEVPSNYKVDMIDYRIRRRLYNAAETQYRSVLETAYKSDHDTATAEQVLAIVNQGITDFYYKSLTTLQGDSTKWNAEVTAEKIRVGEYLAVKNSIQKKTSSASATDTQTFEIVFGRRAMESVSTPTARLNLAVFAYDAQTTRDNTATGANQANPSATEDIKLSISNPLPPAITVKDEATRTVATIDNIGGYLFGYDTPAKRLELKRALGGAGTLNLTEEALETTEVDAYDKFVKVKASTAGTDEQKSDTGSFSDSAVTVSFDPRQDYFKQDTDENEQTIYVRGSGAGAQTFYEDIYGTADMSGSAQIVYVGYYWKPGATDAEKADPEAAISDPETLRDTYHFDPDEINNLHAWTQATGDTAEQIANNTTPISSAETLTFSADGTYMIKAWVVNGSGTLSKEPRVVTFDIDTQAPENMNVQAMQGSDGNYTAYTSGNWAQAVQLRVDGATDLNRDVYEYSTDNGRTWYKLGAIGQQQFLNIPTPILDATTNPVTYATVPGGHAPITSGQYDVIIRAKDKAGNTSTPQTINVKVDDTAPITSAPKLTASSTSSKEYGTYVVSVASGGHGTITASVNNITRASQLENPIVDVPSNGTVDLTFSPAGGYKVGTVTDNGETAELMDNAGVKSYKLSGVVKDHNILVTFVSDGSTPSGGGSDPVSDGTNAAIGAAQATSAVLLTREDQYTPATGAIYEVTAEATGDGAGDVVIVGTENQTEEKKTRQTGTVGDGKHLMVYAKANVFNKLEKISVKIGEGATKEYGLNDFNTETSGKYKDYFFITTDAIDGTTAIDIAFSKLETRTVVLEEVDAEVGVLSLQEDADKIVNNGSDYTVLAGEGEQVNLMIESQKGYMPVKVLVDDVQKVYNDGAAIATMQSIDVPAGENPLKIKVEFAVDVSGGAYVSVPVTVEVKGSGSVTPGASSTGDSVTQVLELPNNVSKSFIITPADHYELYRLLLTTHKINERTGQAMEQTVTTVETSLVKPIGGRQVYSFIPAAESKLVAEFTMKKHKITVSSSVGGTVTVTRDDRQEPVALTAAQMASGVEETVPVTINISAKAGYKVKNVEIVHNGTALNVGNVSKYTFDTLVGPLAVRVDFEERSVTGIPSSHTITAVAEGVSDADSELATNGYRFVIRKGTINPEHVSQGWASKVSDVNNIENWPDWSDWQSSNTAIFDEVYVDGVYKSLDLFPNEAFTVYVQTRDKVGNKSKPVGDTVFTMANVAGTVAVENKNDEGNSSTKSVLLTIDENGNPAHTEYRAYYSTDASMNDAGTTQFAALNTTNGWKYPVSGLLPGNRYYLQAESVNHDGKVTPKDGDDMVDIMLSPAAPERGTFYYELQEDPTAPVKLYWEQPAGDVTAVQIWRGDTYLDTLDKDVTTYEDTDGYQFFADSIIKYSYNFVNAAGPGSSQTAISKAYYNALKDDDTSLATAITAVEDSHNQLFSETMTYPAYPLDLTAANVVAGSASSGSSDTYTGTLTVTMNTDLTIMRYQEYVLYLKAFEVESVDSDGVKHFKSDEDDALPLDTWDANKKHRDKDNENEQAVVTTKILPAADGSYAPTAVWTGLDSRYGYKVYVKEIRSTGRGNEGGQASGNGVEGYLGLKFYVNKEGFGYTYNPQSGLNASVAAMLKNSSGTWDEAADTEAGVRPLQAYIRSKAGGWDAPLYAEVTGFNETPHIMLADDWYTGNKYAKEANGKHYVLVNSDNAASLDFTVKVYAWDTDAKEKDTPSVKATLAGLTGEAVVNGVMNKTEAEARAKPYYIKFNARGLTTGVYGRLINGETNLKLMADDGTTVGAPASADEKGITLVVNQNKPQISPVNGTKQRLENGTAVTKASLAATNARLVNDPTTANQNLAEVATIVMEQQYLEAGFTVTDYNALKSYLVDGTIPEGYAARVNELKQALSKATALLTAGGYTGTDYINTNGMAVTYNAETLHPLTIQGLNVALLSVAPPTTKYVLLGTGTAGRTKYEAARVMLTEEDQAKYLYVEGGRTKYYWMELESALANGCCEWLRTGEYVKLTEAQYNTASSGSYAAEKLFTTGTEAAKNLIYWMELNAAKAAGYTSQTALEGDTVSPIIALKTDGTYSANDSVNTRNMKVMTEFGGNSKATSVDYIIRDIPSTKISSEKVFTWREVGEQEFRYYATNMKNKNDSDTEITNTTGVSISSVLNHPVTRTVYNEATKFTNVTAVWEGGQVTFFNGDNMLSDPAYRILDSTGHNEVSFADYNAATAEQRKEFTYQVYKLEDNKGTVTTTSVSVQVETFLGIHDSLKRVGLYITTTDEWRPPADGMVTDESKINYAIFNNEVGGRVMENGPFVVNSTGLEADHTYYLWSFYELDGEAEGKRHFTQTRYIAMTTADSFPTAYYGFRTLRADYKEELQPGNSDNTVPFEITAMKEYDGNETAWGTLWITPTYYLADEFGNPLYDTDGNLVEITNDAKTVTVKTGNVITDPETGVPHDETKVITFGVNTLVSAKDAISLEYTSANTSVEQGETIPEGKEQSIHIALGRTQTSETFNVRMKNNAVTQHHLILRLTMSIKSHENGFCQLIHGADKLDIFLRDDEDTVTAFKMGVSGEGYYQGDDKDNVDMKALNGSGTADDPTTKYEYQFNGLQVGYVKSGVLTLSYRNTGDGDLNNIKAELYPDEGGATNWTGDVPFIVEDMDMEDLLKSTDLTGTMQVHPAPGLADGVHEAWLILKADNMEEKDYIRIHLKQVVGQSTLKGQIYLVSGMEHSGAKVGESTVEVYDYANINGVTLPEKPDYTTTTDMYGNYTIQNILNGKKYHIVVKRDGFVTYNSLVYGRGVVPIDLTKYSGSHTFTLDVWLRGGDIGGANGSTEPDGKIDADDLNLLTTNYAKYWDHYAGVYDYHQVTQEEFSQLVSDGTLTLQDVLDANMGSINTGTTFKGLTVTWNDGTAEFASGAAGSANPAYELTDLAYKIVDGSGKSVTYEAYAEASEAAKKNYTYRVYTMVGQNLTKEELDILRRCDFNGDGVINSLDRNYLFSNLNFEESDYTFSSLAPTD